MKDEAGVENNVMVKTGTESLTDRRRRLWFYASLIISRNFCFPSGAFFP